MSDQTELEVRRALESAMASNDAQAELAARRALSQKFGRMGGFGGGTVERVAQKHAGFDLETGLPVGQRAEMSIKMTPQGKSSYLEAQYGAENVAKDTQNNVYYRQSPEDKWTVTDPAGLEFGDAADLAGPAFPAVPTIAAGFMTRMPPVMAATAAAGDSARQAVSSMLPGDDQMTPVDRFNSAAGEAILAGISQKGGNRLANLLNVPQNAVAGHFGRSMASAQAKRGRKLAEDTGVGLFPGQETQSRTGLLAEGFARRHPLSSDAVQALDERQYAQAVDRLRGIQGPRVSDVQAGESAANTVEAATRRAVNARRAQADIDFGRVAQVSGNQPIFSLQNVINEIDTLVDDLSTPVGSDTANQTLKAIAELRNRITGAPRRPNVGGNQVDMPSGANLMNLTPKQFQRTMEIWGKAAGGTGNILADVGDISTNKMINKRLFGALNRDLDAAADMPGGGDVVDALRTARTNYRAGSEGIKKISKSELGRLLGGMNEVAPEKVIDRIMNMKGSDVKKTRTLIEQTDPQAWTDIKSAMIERAFRGAMPGGGAPNPSNFSPAKFRSFMNKNQEQFLSAFSPREVGSLKRLYEVLGRVANRGGTDGSPTAPLMWVANLLSGAGPTLPGMAAIAGKVMAPNKIAKIMADPQGLRRLSTVLNAKGTTKAKLAAMTYLTALVGAEAAENSPDVEQQIQPPR